MRACNFPIRDKIECRGRQDEKRGRAPVSDATLGASEMGRQAGCLTSVRPRLRGDRQEPIAGGPSPFKLTSIFKVPRSVPKQKNEPKNDHPNLRRKTNPHRPRNNKTRCSPSHQASPASFCRGLTSGNDLDLSASSSFCPGARLPHLLIFRSFHEVQ